MRAAALLLALLWAAPAGAADQEARAEARRRFDAAERHFQRGAYARALVEYEAGYRISRLPGFLINIGQCHRLTGDLRKARAYYRKFLLVVPDSPRREEVEEIILAIDEAIATEVSGPAPRTSSARWWLWSALAGSVVGSTVATMALAAAEDR